METIETILLSAKFIKEFPELDEQIGRLPLLWWHSTIREFLLYFPFPATKQKVIVSKNNPKVTFGILGDHIARIARRLEIPNVYIANFVSGRYWNKLFEYNADEDGKVKLNTRTYDLLEAILEKARKNNANLFKDILKEYKKESAVGNA